MAGVSSSHPHVPAILHNGEKGEHLLGKILEKVGGLEEKGREIPSCLVLSYINSAGTDCSG